MKRPIYLDNHATTPVDPRVLEAMMPFYTHDFGNAASRNHVFGWRAEEAVEKARSQVAALINAEPKEIIFTSGATESDNLAIKGVAEMYREKGNHIITLPTEHKAVLDTCKHLEQEGFNVTYLEVGKDGLIRLPDLEKAITPKTVLVAIMAANNEIGVLQPLAKIGKLCADRGTLFFSDGVQAAGKIPLNVKALGIHLLALSAHKIYGPKGVGALYVQRKSPRVRLTPIIDGGGHERGMRSGTLNVPGIVGFGAACEIAGRELDPESKRLRELRDRLEKGILGQLDYVTINGSAEHRLPGNSNMTFAFVEGESLMMGIPDIAVSSGSACTSASLEPSYVLRAIGLGPDLAHSAIRFGLGRFTTIEEIDYTVERVVAAVKKLRAMSPLYEMAQEGVDLKSIKWGTGREH